jgi:hypothetical protein
MKLSKTQLNALAVRIQSDATKKRDQMIATKKKDKNLNKNADDIIKIINSIPVNVRKKLYIDKSRDSIVSALLDVSNIKKVKSVNEIESDLIIASIDAQDIEKLVAGINPFSE